jgi:hypothetical protein
MDLGGPGIEWRRSVPGAGATRDQRAVGGRIVSIFAKRLRMAEGSLSPDFELLEESPIMRARLSLVIAVTGVGHALLGGRTLVERGVTTAWKKEGTEPDSLRGC